MLEIVSTFAAKNMSWIYLIIAGLMEVGFTFCLGKTKAAVGASQYYLTTDALQKENFLSQIRVDTINDKEKSDYYSYLREIYMRRTLKFPITEMMYRKF